MSMDIKKIKDQVEMDQDRSFKPSLFDLNNHEDCEILNKLFLKHKIQIISDDYKEQQRELFAVRNPQLAYNEKFDSLFEEYYHKFTEKDLLCTGRWVYFPWSGSLVHVLEDDEFQLVRTSRNRDLINADEQKKFYNSTIGIAGLSVGSTVALAVTLQGGAKNLKIADMDVLALSNTNRVLSGVQNLGIYKVEMVAKKVYEINPYSIIEVYPEGLSKNNIDHFFKNLDLVVDEVDNIAVKFLIREQAKKNKIAVVMGADNGDNAVIDIERYDIDPLTPYFHNRMGNVTYELLKNLNKFGVGRMITKHIGAQNVTVRMQQSLLEMGKTIVSWPQLGGAAMLNGSAIAYCIRKILLGQEIENNRSLISLDELLIPSYNNSDKKRERVLASEKFKEMFKI